jgi:hypothetical protein
MLTYHRRPGESRIHVSDAMLVDAWTPTFVGATNSECLVRYCEAMLE